MRDVATIQTMLEPLLPGLMGVRLTEVSPERVRAQMEVRPDLCTTGGILHGGAYMAFAKVNTVVTGESIALHRGRTTMVWQIMVRNAEGRLCAVVTQTQLVMGNTGACALRAKAPE